jgi:hypothetical protein
MISEDITLIPIISIRKMLSIFFVLTPICLLAFHSTILNKKTFGACGFLRRNHAIMTIFVSA